jgi:2-polyprenyl-3-methyl-5-hydroxy-6-metoxy-1,4-benzoquinol methylase
MNPDQSPPKPQVLTQETQDIWNKNAQWWDESRGEGNQFHKIFVRPPTERLLGECERKIILDIGCGNGSFARRLAEMGASVVACDFSDKLLEYAKARTTKQLESIEYRLIDATNYEQLMTLEKRRFDAAVCNMALMDMTTIQPLISALSQLLKIRGCFIFSIPHPCFNSNACKMVMEQENKDGQLVTSYSVQVSKYTRVPPGKGLATIEQPTPHYYFHRPLSVLFNTCFQEGFVLDSIEEPTYDIQKDKQLLFSCVDYSEIPPILVTRMRLDVG